MEKITDCSKFILLIHAEFFLISSIPGHLWFAAVVLFCDAHPKDTIGRQILGLLDDDWMFPGPALEPLLGDIFRPPTEEQLEERREKQKKAQAEAKERKWQRENAEHIKKEMQQSISKRLKALPSKSRLPPEPEPEPEDEGEGEGEEEVQLGEAKPGW